MASQTQSAGMEGMGTTKRAGATLASSTLAAIIGSAIPELCKHADIRVISGIVYIENDGTAADANVMMFEAGEKWQIRNSRALISTLTIFADAAYDIRISLFE